MYPRQICRTPKAKSSVIWRLPSSLSHTIMSIVSVRASVTLLLVALLVVTPSSAAIPSTILQRSAEFRFSFSCKSRAYFRCAVCFRRAPRNLRRHLRSACGSAVYHGRSSYPLKELMEGPGGGTRYSPRWAHWLCFGFVRRLAYKPICVSGSIAPSPTPSPSVSPLPTELTSLPIVRPAPMPPTHLSRQVEWDYFALYELFAALGNVLVKATALPLTDLPPKASLPALVTPEPLFVSPGPSVDGNLETRSGTSPYSVGRLQETEDIPEMWDSETGLRVFENDEMEGNGSDDNMDLSPLSRTGPHAGIASNIVLHTSYNIPLRKLRELIRNRFFPRRRVRFIYSKNYRIWKTGKNQFRLVLYRHSRFKRWFLRV